MISGFACVPFFKFVVQPMKSIWPTFEQLDVLAPSFALAMIAGRVFTKLFPARAMLG